MEVFVGILIIAIFIIILSFTLFQSNHQKALKMIDEGNVDNAMDFYNLEVEKNPENIVAIKELADIYYYREFYEKAETLYEKIDYICTMKKKKNPYECDNREKLISWYLKNNNHNKAFLEIRKLIQVSPTNYEYFYNLGLYYSASGVYPNAVECFKRLISSGVRKDLKIYFLIGVCQFLMRDYENARETFEQIVSTDNAHEFSEAFLYLAQISSEHSPRQAIAYLKVMSDLGENRLGNKINTQIFEGIMLVETEDFDKAYEHFITLAKYGKVLSTHQKFIIYMAPIVINIHRKTPKLSEDPWKRFFNNCILKNKAHYYDLFHKYQRGEEQIYEIVVKDWDSACKKYNLLVEPTDVFRNYPIVDVRNLDLEFENWRIENGYEPLDFMDRKILSGIENPDDFVRLISKEMEVFARDFLEKIGMNFEKIISISSEGIICTALSAKSSEQKIQLVCFKKWKGVMGVDPIGSFAEEMKLMGIEEGKFITSAMASEKARNLAATLNIRLLDKSFMEIVLKNKIIQTEKDIELETKTTEENAEEKFLLSNKETDSQEDDQ